MSSFHFLPSWLFWISTILWVLFFITFIFLFVYLFVTLANIVAAPFNSLLAEQVEFYLTGNRPLQRTLYENVKDVPRIIARQLSIIVYYLPRVIALSLLSFVPVVQAIAAFLWLLFNAWFMALTYFDYPTDNHRIAIPVMQEWLAERRFSVLGFGLGVVGLSLIPGINFLLMPAAVAGATQFWLQER
jgi:CysZ protein